MPGLHFLPHWGWHQQLHLLHVNLAESTAWYKKWHERQEANRTHWIALLVFSLLVTVAATSRALAAREPRLLSLDLGISTVPYEYGRSQRGNPLKAYTYGSEPWVAKHIVYVVGALHGHERSSAVLAADLARHLSSHPADIPAGTRVIVIPLANPDGYQRKLRTNARSVDLNRNFATSDWRRYSGGPLGRREFGGRVPFSEPEAEALKQLMEREQPDVVLALHAQGNLINPEPHLASQELARRIADESGHRYLETWGFYPATGTLTLWTMERFGAASITWELASYTFPDWHRNGGALLSSLRP